MYLVGERASEGGEADGQNEADKVIEDASTKFFVATEVHVCTCTLYNVPVWLKLSLVPRLCV